MSGLRREVLRLYKQVRGTLPLIIPSLSSDNKPFVCMPVKLMSTIAG